MKKEEFYTFHNQIYELNKLKKILEEISETQENARDGPITKKLIKKTIREYLKTDTSFNNALEKFHCKGNWIKNLTEKCLKDKNPINYCKDKLTSIKADGGNNSMKINDSFFWGETKEGHSYWSRIYQAI